METFLEQSGAWKSSAGGEGSVFNNFEQVSLPGARAAGVSVEEQPRDVGSVIRRLLWPLGLHSPAGKSQPGLRFLCWGELCADGQVSFSLLSSSWMSERAEFTSDFGLFFWLVFFSRSCLLLFLLACNGFLSVSDYRVLGAGVTCISVCCAKPST